MVKSIRCNNEKKLSSSDTDSFGKYNLENQALHEAGYDSFLTAWVYIQMQILVNKPNCYENHLNIGRSFFYMNLSSDEDIVNPYYSENLIRVGVEIKLNEDARTRRHEEVGKIRDTLKEFKQGCDYLIH